MPDLRDLSHIISAEPIGDTGNIIIVDDQLYVILTVSKVSLGSAKFYFKVDPRRIFVDGPSDLPVILTSISPATAKTLKLTRILEKLDVYIQPGYNDGLSHGVQEVWLLRQARR